MATKGNKRNAQGTGSIRKKTVTRNGKQYTYYEARVTVGRDELTGKQKQKSITGSTQAEVVERMKAMQMQVQTKQYIEPAKMTVAQWFNLWIAEYTGSMKPRTVIEYTAIIEHHINPALGKTKLSKLTREQVQVFCNRLVNQRTGKPLAPKTIKCIHGVLHDGLEQAVKNGHLPINPADNTELPKLEQKEAVYLEQDEIVKFLQAIQGHYLHDIFFVTLFTGMRESEVCGLTWDEIDFKSGSITIKHQIQRRKDTNGKYVLVTPKGNKSRTIHPAKAVMDVLAERKKKQFKARLAAGDNWSNETNFVFTHDDNGTNYCPHVVYENFKSIAKSIGCENAKFHSLRHSYATISLLNGDDIRTVQGALGHYSAAFTQQVYSHVMDVMAQRSTDRMNDYISELQTMTA